METLIINRGKSRDNKRSGEEAKLRALILDAKYKLSHTTDNITLVSLTQQLSILNRDLVLVTCAIENARRQQKSMYVAKFIKNEKFKSTHNTLLGITEIEFLLKDKQKKTRALKKEKLKLRNERIAQNCADKPDLLTIRLDQKRVKTASQDKNFSENLLKKQARGQAAERKNFRSMVYGFASFIVFFLAR